MSLRIEVSVNGVIVNVVSLRSTIFIILDVVQ